MFRLWIGFVVIMMSVPLHAADPRTPYVVGHRGLLHHAPENTLAGFRACLNLRIGFEFDVTRSKDGTLVCIHDDSVNRTTNGQGRVADMTLEQLRQLDAGSRFDQKFAGEKIPTIDEVLKLIAEYRDYDVLITVDLKAAGVEQDVVQLAEKYRVLHRLLFIGTTISSPAVRKQLKSASHQAITAALANNSGEFAHALAADADWVYLRFLPNAEQMQAIRQVKKRVFIAGKFISENQPGNWRQMQEQEVDGILTDFPLTMAHHFRLSRQKP
ncbi:MAG: hypothetical protein LC104_17460 [Bacteroidales bacterium]|nr:hypothetical protein [Bacteroidales bacterium]